MAHIGNAPFGKTVRTVTTETLTSIKTAFYPTGGYIVGYVDVYVNGVRLTEAADFVATDGTTVTLQYNPSIGDTVDVVTYGSIEMANAVRRDGDTLVGTLFTRALVPTANITYDIGTDTMRYRDIYLSGNTINLGDIKLSTNGTAFSVANTTGGTFPSALANTTITGTLTANATTITGNVSVTGTATVNGNIFFGNNYLFINTSNNTAGGFDNKLTLKQSNTSWTGGIAIEAQSNDHLLILGSNSTAVSISSTYRTLSGYKTLSLRNGDIDALRVFANGNIGISNNAPYHRLSIDGVADTYNPNGWPGKATLALTSGSNANGDYSGIRFTNPGGSREGFLGFVQTTSNQNDLIVQGYNGSVYREWSRTGYFGTTYPQAPVFFAVGLPGGGNLNAATGNGIITFATEQLDRSNSWSGSRFTAPVSGVYYMGFEQMYQHQGGDITFQIWKNGTAVSYNNPHTKDSGNNYPAWSTSTVTWVGLLNTNDYVEYAWFSGGVSSTIIYGAGLYTKVYGYLIG